MKPNNDLYASALDMLIQSGAVEKCPAHSNVSLHCYPETGISRALALAARRVACHEISAPYERVEFALLNAYDDAYSECPECRSEFRLAYRPGGLDETQRTFLAR